MEVWYGTIATSNLAEIRKEQSKILGIITFTPRYASNLTLHTNLRVPFVKNTYVERYKIFSINCNGAQIGTSAVCTYQTFRKQIQHLKRRKHDHNIS